MIQTPANNNDIIYKFLPNCPDLITVQVLAIIG